MIIKQVSLLAGILFLASCTTATKQAKNEKMRGSPASLVSYSLDDRYITIDVVSHGCTVKTNFQLRLVSLKENSFEVVKTKHDLCRMAPLKMSLNYPFRHLGIDLSRPIQVTNPVSRSHLAQN